MTSDLYNHSFKYITFLVTQIFASEGGGERLVRYQNGMAGKDIFFKEGKRKSLIFSPYIKILSQNYILFRGIL